MFSQEKGSQKWGEKESEENRIFFWVLVAVPPGNGP